MDESSEEEIEELDVDEKEDNLDPSLKSNNTTLKGGRKL